MIEISMLRNELADSRAESNTQKSLVNNYEKKIYHLTSHITNLELKLNCQIPPGPINDIPNEMVYSIFSFLPLSDILKCEQYIFLSF